MAGGCCPQLRGGACLGRIFLKGVGVRRNFGGDPTQRIPAASGGPVEFSGRGETPGPSGKFVAPAGSPTEKWERGVICFTRAGGRWYRWGVAGRWGRAWRVFMNARPGARTRAPGASRAPVFLYGSAAHWAAFASNAYARREKCFVFSGFCGEDGVEGVGHPQVGHQCLELSVRLVEIQNVTMGYL